MKPKVKLKHQSRTKLSLGMKMNLETKLTNKDDILAYFSL